MPGVSQSLIARIEKGTVDPAFSKVEKIFSVLQKEHHESDVTAGQIMSKTILSISPLRSLSSAVNVMKRKNISQMPVKKDGVVVTTDLKMMGVAGDNSWGARPYEPYCLPAKNYSFKFSIEPIF